MSDELENEMPTRKKNRLENFDYSSCGAYFVTICTEGRRPILSRIVGGGVLDAPISVELCIYGQVADRYIRQMNDFYHDIQVKRYVIMPNHIHLLIVVSDSGASGRRPLQSRMQPLRGLFRHLKDFATRNMEKIYGNVIIMTILFVIARITRIMSNTSTKIRSIGRRTTCI